MDVLERAKVAEELRPRKVSDFAGVLADPEWKAVQEHGLPMYLGDEPIPQNISDEMNRIVVEERDKQYEARQAAKQEKSGPSDAEMQMMVDEKSGKPLVQTGDGDYVPLD